jgi:hypothetical protein
LEVELCSKLGGLEAAIYLYKEIFKNWSRGSRLTSRLKVEVAGREALCQVGSNVVRLVRVARKNGIRLKVEKWRRSRQENNQWHSNMRLNGKNNLAVGKTIGKTIETTKKCHVGTNFGYKNNSGKKTTQVGKKMWVGNLVEKNI